MEVIIKPVRRDIHVELYTEARLDEPTVGRILPFVSAVINLKRVLEILTCKGLDQVNLVRLKSQKVKANCKRVDG